jgi:hypothetical protein
MLLQELEEVLDFDAAIFWHVCAVNGVSDSVQSKLSSTVKKARMSVTTFGLDFSTYLRVLGRKCFAISGSWGPQRFLKDATAFC